MESPFLFSPWGRANVKQWSNLEAIHVPSRREPLSSYIFYKTNLKVSPWVSAEYTSLD